MVSNEPSHDQRKGGKRMMNRKEFYEYHQRDNAKEYLPSAWTAGSAASGSKEKTMV